MNARLSTYSFWMPYRSDKEKIQGGRNYGKHKSTASTWRNMETFQRLPFKARKSVFEKLEQIVDIASLSKEDRMKYDESIKVYRDHLAVLDFAKQEGLELGMRQGMVKGIEQGMAKGIAKGIEQGKNEGEMNERLKNARRMKTKGYPIDDIADITGLSTEEINSL